MINKPETTNPTEEKIVTCERGREIGCQTYCCMLIVRLTKEEAKELYPNDPNRLSVDKNPQTGYCEFLDVNSKRCTIFERRPKVCREYTCKGDKFLQVAIKQPIESIAELSKRASKTFIPIETYIEIPER